MSDKLVRLDDAIAIVRKSWTDDEMVAELCALPAVSVGVKPLEWRRDSMKGSYPARFRAKMPCKGGDYSVAGSERENLWQWFRNGYFVDGHQLHKAMPIEAAKAAAQDDYEARILAALTPAPAADVKELVEAATGVMARLVVAFPDVETYPPTVRLAAALAAFEKENGK